MITIEEAHLTQARRNLSNFVLHCAEVAAEDFGVVGWEAVPGDYVTTLADMKKEMREARLQGRPYRVWAGGSDKSIYTSPGVNHAFRFWHDALHISLGCDTTLIGEFRVGTSHEWRVAHRFRVGSVEHMLMRIDTVEQTFYHERHGQFPEDQLAFACRVLGMEGYEHVRI